MKHDDKVKGIIFDIDGTLVLNGQAISGAVETVARLREADFCLRFVTNTTRGNSARLAETLSKMGFILEADEIQTSVSACLHYISRHFADSAGYLAIPKNIKPLFKEIRETEHQPDFIVLGDLDDEFNYEILNRVFNFMRDGARLIAFHRNPFYFRFGKTWLDSGAFTMTLESITNQRAVIAGKPSPTLFNAAISSMSLPKNQVIVVGDDVSSDIKGAENAGLKSFLVGSGKFKPTHLTEYHIGSEAFLPQISDLLPLLNVNG